MTTTLRKTTPEFVEDVVVMSHHLAALLVDSINDMEAEGRSSHDAINITLRATLTAIVAILMQETGSDFDIEDLVAMLRDVATPSAEARP